jgi:hypothetical protein
VKPRFGAVSIKDKDVAGGGMRSSGGKRGGAGS